MLRAERRLRRDPFEVAVLIVFGLLSCWMLALDLNYAIGRHLVWTGTDGWYVPDQMQYLAWIRDAAGHFLASDMFVLRATPHDYLQPIVVLPAGLTALGVAPWLGLLLWKPVAVIACFLAVRAYARRSFTERFERRAMLVLALFYGSFGVTGDEWIPFLSWGYPFAVLAIAGLAGTLVVYDRARAGGRFSWLAPALGLFTSWVHPWQGELLIVTVIGAEALSWRSERRPRATLALSAATVGASIAPLLYYEALHHFDAVWRESGLIHDYPLVALVKPLAPLLVLAALAFPWRPRGFLSAATRIWPLAVLAIYWLSRAGLGGAPQHAFDGITIPLAVLAIEGARRLGLRRIPGWQVIAVGLVAAAAIPASLSMMRASIQVAKPRLEQSSAFITRSEQRALAFLAGDPQRGGVLTGSYLGVLVPAETGRRTYLGSRVWSQPDPAARAEAVARLFAGRLSPPAAQAFVSATHARFILASCAPHVDLARMLGGLVVSARRFGCASIYEVRPPVHGAHATVPAR